MGSIVTLALGAVDTIAGASLGALAVAILLHLFKVAAEARSWHGIVRHTYPVAGPRFRTTYAAFAGAIGVNAILPARVGEALRLGIMRRNIQDSNVATIGGTMVLETGIEAMFGLVVVAVVLLAGRSIGPLGSPVAVIGSSRPALAALVATGILVAVALWFLRRRIRRVAAAMAKGMSVLAAPRQLLLGVLGWKFLAWALRFAAVYWFLMAFHLSSSVWIVLLVVAAQNVAGALPLAPGSAGTQQAVLTVALAGTATASAAVGFGVGFQVATGLSDILFGIAAVIATSSWREIHRAMQPARKRVTAAAASPS